MSGALPVVTVHFGAQPHVLACLRATLRHNPAVWLIGDASSAHFARELTGVRWIHRDELEPHVGLRSFQESFRNYSSNPHEFELRCFTRMFYVRALLGRLRTDACFHLDSDCALLTPIDAYPFAAKDALVRHADFGNPLRMTASVHNARLTVGFLDRFIRLCGEIYVTRERLAEVMPKFHHHRDRQIPGGVCDMTLYHLVTRELDVQDLGRPRDGSAFDHRFGSPEGDELAQQYEMDGEHKRISRRGDAIYIHDVRGATVRLLSMHFQGIAKRFVDLLPE